ncbi:MAG: pentapeptide repeat-containing protein [candidate division NC10 bacterium]|nr:pentapeptide repeat-containing protein [candidate division NC10 bacterium]
MALIRDSKLANLLREGHFEEFNRLAAQEPPDLRNADLRMLDLRHADLTHADLRGAYLRNADLRGLDLSEASLEGASLHDTRVSGVLFPAALHAEEIRLSLTFGTRMRAR